VFLDPPYRKGLVRQAAVQLVEQELIAPGGTLVVETAAANEALPLIEAAPPLALEKQRTYGDSALWLYRTERGVYHVE